MKDLNYYKEQIKQKRKQTDFRDFLKEITSWLSFTYYRNNGLISRYPKTDRVKITSFKKFEENRDSLIEKGKEYDFSKTFFENFENLILDIEFPNLVFYGTNENTDFSDQTLIQKMFI